jgi:hypothetical protein
MYDFEFLNAATLEVAAIKYISVGWHIIPLDGKRPITPWTTDPKLSAQAAAILFEDATFNLGIVMGHPSQLVALDIDGAAGMEFLLNTLTAQDASPDVLQTLNFETPNGGHRFLYQYTAIQSRSIRHNGKELVRIMSNGTQTVAPPSTIDGRPYRWHPPYHLAPCPLHVFEALTRRDTPRRPGRPDILMQTREVDKVQRARRYLAKCEPAISGQGGHNHTFKLAVKMVKGFGLSFHEAFALMCEWNESCQPPWSEDELQHKIEDACKVNAASGSLL